MKEHPLSGKHFLWVGLFMCFTPLGSPICPTCAGSCFAGLYFSLGTIVRFVNKKADYGLFYCIQLSKLHFCRKKNGLVYC